MTKAVIVKNICASGVSGVYLFPTFSLQARIPNPDVHLSLPTAVTMYMVSLVASRGLNRHPKQLVGVFSAVLRM